MWIDQRGSEILPGPECLRLLAVAAKDGAISRVAVTDEPAPLMVPLNFAFHDGGVLVRVGPGRLADTMPGSIVSFEVDRVAPDDGPDDGHGHAWSVLLRGLASTVGADAVEAAGADLPHPLVPEPGDLLLHIRPDVVTGRRFPLLAPAEGAPAP
jgi:hypothetical protein